MVRRTFWSLIFIFHFISSENSEISFDNLKIESKFRKFFTRIKKILVNDNYQNAIFFEISGHYNMINFLIEKIFSKKIDQKTLEGYSINNRAFFEKYKFFSNKIYYTINFENFETFTFIIEAKYLFHYLNYEISGNKRLKITQEEIDANELIISNNNVILGSIKLFKFFLKKAIGIFLTVKLKNENYEANTQSGKINYINNNIILNNTNIIAFKEVAIFLKEIFINYKKKEASSANILVKFREYNIIIKNGKLFYEKNKIFLENAVIKQENIFFNIKSGYINYKKKFAEISNIEGTFDEANIILEKIHINQDKTLKIFNAFYEKNDTKISASYATLQNIDLINFENIIIIFKSQNLKIHAKSAKMENNFLYLNFVEIFYNDIKIGNSEKGYIDIKKETLILNNGGVNF